MRPGVYEVAKRSGVQGFFWEVRSPRGSQEAVGSGDLAQEVVRRPGHQEVAKRSGRQGSGAQIV